MEKQSLRVLLGASASVVLLAGSVRASAQNVQGGVTGNVTDPSGAVIAGAQVVAHNVETGVDSKAVTDAAGLYRINYLPIGRYTLTVHANGFGDSNVPAFQLEALQVPTFNVKLAPGGASETVTVSDAAPILDTSDATLSGTFTANTIQNFPLNGLDFSALTLYVPGAVSTAGTSGTTSIERSTFYTDSVNLNGNRAQANNYTLDGIDLNETFNNLIAYSPSPEALGEVKVLTANSPADYGNVNGGGIVSVLKSGTNKFHGSLFGYLQDYRLNANNWNNNHAVPKIAKNSYSQDQFGGTLGGPIIPDKLFFFVDYLGSRQHTGGTTTASVFTANMRNGDFSALCQTFNAAGICTTGIQLYDTQNNFAPYLGDKGLPILNPVAKFLFANPNLYPLPNATPEDGITQNDLQGTSRNFHANNQGDIRVDYNPRNADKLSAFYSMSTAYDGTTAVLPVAFPGSNLFPSKVGGANWVHIFSSTVVNSALIGFTRTNWNEGLPVDDTGAFGTSGDSKVGINFPNQAYQGFTFQSIGGGLSGLGNAALDNNTLTDNTYSYIDNLSLQRGAHTFTMGVQALRYENNYPTSNANNNNGGGYLGQLGYSGAFTSNAAVTNGSGFGGADFVLDRVATAAATLGSSNVGQRQWRAAGYVSDDWKASSRLTVNLGVRYEYDQPWYEVNNKTGNINLATGQLMYAGSLPAGAPAGSAVCANRACYQPNYRQIMPRIGFAYQATSRFVVRAGFGTTSFFEGNSSNQRLTSITPFVQAVNDTTSTPVPGTVTQPAPRNAEEGFAGSTTQFLGSFNVYPQNIQPAYVQEYNLTTEYALSRTVSLQVGYLGEQGQHIEDYGNVNQWRTPGDGTSAPYYNNPFLGVNAIDPTTRIGNGQLLITESRAAMNYSALQAVLRQRLNHGLEFTFNYTYGKALTNSLGNYGLNVNGYSGAFQNYYDSAADWGPAGYDVRHNISFNGTYEVPVGQGKEFLSHTNRLVDEVLGGWRIGVAGVKYSGLPETVFLNGNSNNSNSYGNSRPNQYRALKIANRSLTNWFGTDPSATPCPSGVDNGVCAFGVPAANTFGTARNGDVRGPGYLNVDMSAFKDFRTYREQVVGFRFDAFNTFNIASYGNPDTNLQDSTFGNVANQTVRSQERRVQFSAHYRF